MSWTDLMWMSFNREFRSWERNRSRWGNRTEAELSAWVWRTVTFGCMSNLGWRLKGTPSRAAERLVNDDCGAKTCCEKRRKDRDRDRNCWPTINSRDAAISRFVTVVFIREVVSPMAEFIRWHWRRRRVAAERTPTQRVKLCTWSCFTTIDSWKIFSPPGTVDGTYRACSSRDFWLMEKLYLLPF